MSMDNDHKINLADASVSFSSQPSFQRYVVERSPHPRLLKPEARFTPTPAKLKPHLQPVNLRDSLPAVPKLTSDLPDDSVKSIIQRSYHTIQPVYQTQRHPPSTKHTQTLSPGTPTPPQCTLLISQSLYGCYAQRSGIDDMDESVELGPSVIPANDALVVTLDFEGMLNQSSLQHYVLKCRLNQQKLTHNTAGEFLHTVKTLMAKLKANDWALCQNFHWREGCYSPSREAAIQVLSHAWGDYGSRHHMPEDLWIENLLTHIDSLVHLRVAHVREWISSNIARFQSREASMSS
ncbi:hypothetical protein EV702DRAFT_1047779 [Suillus placidus]|uniref:Uncharacterized protein n=1 Tax=Suillus placidus TaxID=48579 RepID=A0A9P6ZPN6_9AGAM|nr:hypothetical protein EV702DRAFT_1047779 [Suillus placidus]